MSTASTPKGVKSIRILHNVSFWPVPTWSGVTPWRPAFGPETEALLEGNLAAHYLLVRGLASHERNTIHAARAS